MAGRFSRRTIAAIAHSVVDHPSAGNTPSAPPSARLNAIFCGVTPCLSRARIGRSSLRLKNPSCTNRLSHLRIRVRRNHGTRVVVNDLPSIREALPNQGKHSSEVIVLPLQMPASQDERCLRPQKPELQFRKIQLSHRAPVGIVLLVSCQHAIPAARYVAAPGKRQLRRTPISHQKRVHIAAVPRGLLCAQNCANGFPVGLALLGRFGQQLSLHEEENTHCRSQSHQCPARKLSHARSPLQTLVYREDRRRTASPASLPCRRRSVA